MIDRGPQLYADNAAAMWSSLTSATSESAAVRIIVRDPGVDVTQLLALAPRDKTVTVEDPYGVTDADVDATVLRMPVMVRDPGEIRPSSGVEVGRVTDVEELAEAERAIVDGFPLAAYRPYERGVALPSLVLTSPQWTVWLARREGRPAGAVCTFDDGLSIGVYWLVTLPEHRSAGVARALLTRAIADCPGRPCTLVATLAGLPLYESLGFVTVSNSRWYVRGRSEE